MKSRQRRRRWHFLVWLGTRWDLLLVGSLGAAAFAYQLPVQILNPLYIRWMMRADRGAALLGWLFERNEPWTLPFGILHTMMPPLVTTVGYSDALPWIAVPAKLLFGWVSEPWQYSGLFLFACYVLQAVFGYLILRALSVGRPLSVLGAAFFATSPALLQRFNHISLCAHWEILAALWLYLRPERPRSAWRLLAPWLLLLVVTIPTYIYLAVMVAALALARYVRALWVERSISLITAATHAVIAGALSYATLWVFGYFVLRSRGEPGFGQFSADVLAFLNSGGWSRFMPPIVRIQQAYPTGYEHYYFLGLGVVALLPVSLVLAILGSRRRSVPTAAAPAAHRGLGVGRVQWPVALWPAVAVAGLMFVYAWGTPITAAGHVVLPVPLYAHLRQFTAWFRGSGRFSWPLYYLIMALVLATVAQHLTLRLAAPLLALALAGQILDEGPLRAVVRRDYDWPRPQLASPLWVGVGRSFRALDLVPPIVANRIACRSYDQVYDYEIRFGVVAAREHMSFNSGNPARVGEIAPLCVPLIDSLERGVIDPQTILVPSASFREAIEWWARGRVVCGLVDAANVCVARPTGAPTSALTQALLVQEPVPTPVVLHFDLSGAENAAFVESTAGFTTPSDSGRGIAADTASIYLSDSLSGAIDLVVDARATLQRIPISIAVGRQAQTVVTGQQERADTLHFSRVDGARLIRISCVPKSAATTEGSGSAGAAHVWIRNVTIRLR